MTSWTFTDIFYVDTQMKYLKYIKKKNRIGYRMYEKLGSITLCQNVDIVKCSGINGNFSIHTYIRQIAKEFMSSIRVLYLYNMT